MLRYTSRLNSLSGLVVTRMDVLSGFEKVQVCVGYKLRGKTIGHVPANPLDLAEVEPIYQEMPGWSGDLRTCRSWTDLPENARKYLDFISEFTGVPIAVVSVGPDREETITVRPELVWA